MILKVKIVCGYNDDEQYTIDAEEAHKAYYLFLNPEKRTVFKEGLALLGKDVRRIEPDYNATMGWNHTYKLGDDDWSDIRSKGIDAQLKDLLAEAKDIAYLANSKPEILGLPLSKISITKNTLPTIKSEEVRSIGEIIKEKQ